MMVVEEQALKFPRADMDTPWKHALSIYLQEFMALCLPDIAEQIDWARGHHPA